MKRVLKGIGQIVGALVVAAVSGALYVNFTGLPHYDVEKIEFTAVPTPERLARGKKLATMLCATCHMDPTTQKLTGKRMADAPVQFGVVYSKNITQHPTKGIGAWTDSEIAYLLRTGVSRDGTYVPPWMVKLPHLSDEDLASIIVFLRSDDPRVAPTNVDPPGVSQPSFLTKVLSRIAFKKIPYPTRVIVAPPVSDKVAYGRYLVAGLDCYGCHSADFATMNIPEPENSPGFLAGGNELPDLTGGTIRSANITFDEETGIGKWSEADLSRALREGFRPDGSLVRYPMAPTPELDEHDIAALYTYLQSVPKQRHPVERALATAPIASGGGKALYQKYGCVSCHGENGVGIADLRQASQHFPTPEALKAWIADAPSIKPGTKMPSWKGVIAEEDYPALMAYVRELGR